ATLTELIESSGHSVTAAGSGAAALRVFAPTHFDVVLSNVGMAGMNGWDFAERLRAIDRQIPLLFITGWGLREEERIRLARLRVSRTLYPLSTSRSRTTASTSSSSSASRIVSVPRATARGMRGWTGVAASASARGR